MDFVKFLIEAKINTYASNGEGGEKILYDGSKELVHENGDFSYRDRYFGFNPFVGEEVVFERGRAIWGMNYYGQITDEKIDGKEVYRFLKKAIRRVKLERPFRGPKDFQDDEWNYKNESCGDINNFYGEEEIYFKNKKVYELKYHGGRIAKEIDMYNPPLNIEEIKKMYPDRAEELLKDPVHLWRAETGIELIHREPSREEQERIWDNWNEMTEEKKKQSDEKSRELFGKDNRSHHAEIMKKYT